MEFKYLQVFLHDVKITTFFEIKCYSLKRSKLVDILDGATVELMVHVITVILEPRFLSDFQ